ncbi:hypothetical protein, partial [Armatimonas sp.]|uniref:hypothetical protein n=1 Tax=Armatimonas sp. TaxID=1872638 RepID=UPI0037501A90
LAAGPKLTLTPHFSAALMPGYEQPVTVTLTNPADGAAFSGEVVLSQGTQQWQTPVTLPAGASVATVTVRVRYASSSWLPSKVLLRSTRGDVVAAQTWNPAVKPEGLLRVLVVSKDGSAGTWEGLNGQVSGVHRESGRLVPGGPRRVPGQVGMSRELPDEDYFSVVAATPSQLTEQASALAQFGIVVLTSEQGLSAGQKAALQRWVNAGGILVHPEETDTPERVELLGAGRIVHTSATPSVKALVAPWNYVGSLRARFAGQEEENYASSMAGLFPQVLKSSGMQAPPFSTIALFLGAYLLAVVPLQYLILRRLDKREWAWGTTPLLAGAFALGAYVVGGQGRSRAAFYNTAAVIETAAGRTTGAAVARFGLYSPDRTTYSLTAPTADTSFFRTVGDLSSLSSAQVPGQPTRLQDFAVPQWAMRSVSLYTTDLPLGGGVTASLKRRGAVLEGTVTNNTGVTLESVQVHFGTGRALIPNLAPGATQTVGLSFYGQETLLHRVVSGPPPSPDSKEAARRFFPMLSNSVPDEQPSVYGNPSRNRYGSVTRTNEALITALTSQELVPVTIEGGRATPRTTDSLLIIHVPIE